MPASLHNIIASPPPPSAADLRRIRAGDQQACRKLIDDWSPAITIIASGYAARAADLDDLYQVGRIAVYMTALRYKAARREPYSHYTKRAIRNAVLKEVTRLARQRRFEVSLEDGGEQRDEPQEAPGGDAEQIDSAREWVKALPEPHATIFMLLYVRGMKQRPAALEMGVSQPRVAQLHRSLLDLARENLAC